MSEISDFEIQFKIDTRDCLNTSDDVNYIHEISGEITEVDDMDQERKVGQIYLSYVNFLAADNDRIISPFDVLDTFGHTEAYASAILDKDMYPFSRKLEKLFDEDPGAGGANMLTIDQIEILPEYRGHLLGLLAIRSAIKNCGGGAGIVALDVYPLQLALQTEGRYWGADEEWIASMRLGEFPADGEKATRNLIRYFKQFGFRLMPGTGTQMFWNTAFRLPSIRELLESDRDQKTGKRGKS